MKINGNKLTVFIIKFIFIYCGIYLGFYITFAFGSEELLNLFSPILKSFYSNYFVSNLAFLLSFAVIIYFFFYFGTLISDLILRLFFKKEKLKKKPKRKFNVVKFMISLLLGGLNTLLVFLLILTFPKDECGFLVFFSSYLFFFHGLFLIPIIYFVLKDVWEKIEMKKYIYFSLYFFFVANFLALFFDLLVLFLVVKEIPLYLFFLFVMLDIILWWWLLEVGKYSIILKKEKI